MRLIPTDVPAILPNIADIYLAKLFLNCADAFIEIVTDHQGKAEDDITSLMRGLKLFEKALKHKRPPTILKGIAALVALLTIIFKGV